MAQRILEPGEIETLASRDVPRIILADRDSLFAARAERLRALAATSAIGDYLQLLAVLVDAQHAQLAALRPERLAELQSAAMAQQPPAVAAAGMPPLHAASLARDDEWRSILRALCRTCLEHGGFPAEAHGVLERLIAAPDAWLDAQADAVLEVPGAAAIDAVTAPFVMAALQVYWTALALAFKPTDLAPMADAPGLCPLCGTPPVASVVHARAPHSSYRYLSCALCACQWHFVRVQCSHCGGVGKDIAYRALAGIDGDEAAAARDAAVRAETCDHCHGYRKILYLEKDPGVEPVADDLGTLALDLLLGEEGYQRVSQNPLLWQASGD
ncbi:formate dehydrogenase accessory protein FdhE [Solilutibacter silvestris]|uniref:Protein FdhE homolog n=1 Tax=Solilutibacter silvestris TaxID=1645665 RepID=A0A2K1Q3B9_9GAMM|nr:formate dehydrogenase accessory protein FdhE [Lysobacter silvestris]PNS09491.1 FdhE: formate dehydrogenase accessory protein FdhE [Lysobacter silvestris]